MSGGTETRIATPEGLQQNLIKKLQEQNMAMELVGEHFSSGQGFQWFDLRVIMRWIESWEKQHTDTDSRRSVIFFNLKAYTLYAITYLLSEGSFKDDVMVKDFLTVRRVPEDSPFGIQILSTSRDSIHELLKFGTACLSKVLPQLQSNPRLARLNPAAVMANARQLAPSEEIHDQGVGLSEHQLSRRSDVGEGEVFGLRKTDKRSAFTSWPNHSGPQSIVSSDAVLSVVTESVDEGHGYFFSLLGEPIATAKEHYGTQSKFKSLFTRDDVISAREFRFKAVEIFERCLGMMPLSSDHFFAGLALLEALDELRMTFDLIDRAFPRAGASTHLPTLVDAGLKAACDALMRALMNETKSQKLKHLDYLALLDTRTELGWRVNQIIPPPSVIQAFLSKEAPELSKNFQFQMFLNWEKAWGSVDTSSDLFHSLHFSYLHAMALLKNYKYEIRQNDFDKLGFRAMEFSGGDVEKRIPVSMTSTFHFRKLSGTKVEMSETKFDDYGDGEKTELNINQKFYNLGQEKFDKFINDLEGMLKAFVQTHLSMNNPSSIETFKTVFLLLTLARQISSNIDRRLEDSSYGRSPKEIKARYWQCELFSFLGLHIANLVNRNMDELGPREPWTDFYALWQGYKIYFVSPTEMAVWVMVSAERLPSSGGDDYKTAKESLMHNMQALITTQNNGVIEGTEEGSTAPRTVDRTDNAYISNQQVLDKINQAYKLNPKTEVSVGLGEFVRVFLACRVPPELHMEVKKVLFSTRELPVESDKEGGSPRSSIPFNALTQQPSMLPAVGQAPHVTGRSLSSSLLHSNASFSSQGKGGSNGVVGDDEFTGGNGSDSSENSVY